MAFVQPSFTRMDTNTYLAAIDSAIEYLCDIVEDTGEIPQWDFMEHIEYKETINAALARLNSAAGLSLTLPDHMTMDSVTYKDTIDSCISSLYNAIVLNQV